MIKLRSSDGVIFETDKEIAKTSGTIKHLIDTSGVDAYIPLPEVNSIILRKIIAWAEYHRDDPTPIEDNENKEKRTDDIITWDVEFLKTDQGTLFELLTAANYLDMRGLLEATCKTVANMIKGKKPEEICKTLKCKDEESKSK